MSVSVQSAEGRDAPTKFGYPTSLGSFYYTTMYRSALLKRVSDLSSFVLSASSAVFML